MQLRAEQVDPEIPIHWDPQETFADADERGRLRDRVRREVLQLHAVVVAQARRKRLAGAAKPRSWNRTKLTMWLYGGLGTRSLSDGTIHSAGCPSTFAAS
jgi:hypothetical protein